MESRGRHAGEVNNFICGRTVLLLIVRRERALVPSSGGKSKDWIHGYLPLDYPGVSHTGFMSEG